MTEQDMQTEKLGNDATLLVHASRRVAGYRIFNFGNRHAIEFT